jgi:hypothetical protein
VPYAIEDCIPVTAIKTGYFAVDVYIDSPTAPSDTTHWIGLELLKNSVGADYNTTGILILLHYNGTIEVLGANGIDSSQIDTGIIPFISTSFSTHWGSGMTKVTIHMSGSRVNVYIDNVLTLDFETTNTGGFHSLAKYGNVNAYFDTFILRAYVEPNPDQTIWGAEEIRTKRILYDIDVDLAKYNILVPSYTIDTILKKTVTLPPYLIDVDLSKKDIKKQPIIDIIISKKNITSQDWVDAIFKKLNIPKPYSLDVDFTKKDVIVPPYTIDVDFKVTSLKPYNVDVIFKFVLFANYSIDAMLELLDIPKQYFIDAVFAKLNIPLHTLIDTMLKRKDIPVTHSVDALFEMLNIPLGYSIDMILKKLNIPVQSYIDAIFKAVLTLDYSIDVAFTKSQQVSYMIDVVLITIIPSAVGGGQPTEQFAPPPTRFRYVDHITIFLVVQLSIRSLLQQREKSIERLICAKKEFQDFVVQKMKTAVKKLKSFIVTLLSVVGHATKEFFSKLGSILSKHHEQEIPTRQLMTAKEREQDIQVEECGTIENVEISVDVNGVSTVEEGESEFVLSELNTTKEYEQSVPLEQLGVAGENSRSIPVTPLLTKKGKKAKIKDLLDLYESVDETD